jgi:hypothetical protein
MGFKMNEFMCKLVWANPGWDWVTLVGNIFSVIIEKKVK